MTTTYPAPWSVELIRNDSGRAWYAVSRFIGRNRLEYLVNVDGSPRWFRTRPAADKACTKANRD